MLEESYGTYSLQFYQEEALSSAPVLIPTHSGHTLLNLNLRGACYKFNHILSGQLQLQSLK